MVGFGDEILQELERSTDLSCVAESLAEVGIFENLWHFWSRVTKVSDRKSCSHFENTEIVCNSHKLEVYSFTGMISCRKENIQFDIVEKYNGEATFLDKCAGKNSEERKIDIYIY